MVGVPRSRGCRNCRRKKKGCDLQKPICGQCARLNLSCGWDDKTWIFVNQDPAPAAESSQSTQSPARDASGGSNTPAARRAVSLPPETQERALNWTSFEVGSVGEFWSTFLPLDNGRKIGGVFAGFWVQTVQDLAAFDPIAKLSLTACACVALASSNTDYALLQTGTQFYARALRATNKALQDPVQAKSDAILASCKLLAMYESFRVDTAGGISTQAHDWHKHIEGTCRIIELRGPLKHVSQHGHALFEECRITAIIAGITKRKSNFLSKVAWHTIPWETFRRNLRDELCDIMIALPDILSEQDALFRRLKSWETNSDLFNVLKEGQEHVNRCILVGKSLKDWEDKTLGLCIEESSQASEDFAGPLTLLEVCKNHGYGFFHMAMTYWTTCIILYSSLWVVKRNMISATTQMHPLPAIMKLPNLPLWMSPRPAAANIAKCAPHYFIKEAGIWGPLASTFPIGGALHFYAAVGERSTDDGERLRELFAQSRRGYVAGQFLRSMANTANPVKGDPAKLSEHTTMARSWYGSNLP